MNKGHSSRRGYFSKRRSLTMEVIIFLTKHYGSYYYYYAMIMLCFKWRPSGDMGLNDEIRNNVWWTPPESHKAGRCSPIGQHNIARVLFRDNGPVKVLLVTSQAQRHVSTHWLRGNWPQRRVSREG